MAPPSWFLHLVPQDRLRQWFVHFSLPLQFEWLHFCQRLGSPQMARSAGLWSHGCRDQEEELLLHIPDLEVEEPLEWRAAAPQK